MFNNLTLNGISSLLTFLLTVLLCGLFILSDISSFDLPVYKFFLLSIAIILSFLIIRFVLLRTIYVKMQPIYKIMSDRKTVTDSFNSNTSLDEVNLEVEKWAEQKQEELKTLKTLEDYRKNYVGNVSHELKTPIFSIQGYLHTLVEGGMYDEKINLKYLKKALSNTERLETIVNDLEMIAQLNSQSGAIEIKAFDVIKTIKNAIEDLEGLATEEKILLLLNYNLTERLMVMGDENKIRQVIYNLLVNSLKYGKENGRTMIQIFTINNEILIEVSDNGIGIEEEHLKHIFDRFYRVDPSRSRTLGGSGLGLSIVKHIIEAHYQNINVRSTLGEGSTFGFTLKKAN